MIALALLGVLSGSAGCAALLPPPPTRDEVLGRWEAHEDGHTATIDLHGDGTIEIDNVPRAVIQRDTADELDWSNTLDVGGEWSFSEAEDKAFSEALISALLDEPSGGQWLTLYPRSGGLHLYYGDVELSDHLFFELVDRHSTPAPETISRADLTGDWRSSASGVLRLNEDGTFQIDAAPAAFVTYTDDVGDQTPITPAGQWYFAEETVPLDPESAYVSLSFEGMYGPASTGVTKFIQLQETETGLSLTFHDEARWEKD